MLISVVKVATDSPSNPKVETTAKEIVDSDPSTCTEAEKTELKALEAELEEAAETIEEALDDALDALQGMTTRLCFL